MKLAVAGVGKRSKDGAGALIDRLTNVHGEGENLLEPSLLSNHSFCTPFCARYVFVRSRFIILSCRKLAETILAHAAPPKNTRSVARRWMKTEMGGRI